MTSARELAFDILLAVEGSGAFADAMLGRALAEHSGLDRADRALATRLVYGTLARRLTLDHTLAAYSRRPLHDLDAAILTALRLGTFQIAVLDRVPAHAAVNTAVTLASHRVPAGAGYVNAILRRVARDGLVPLPAEPLARLAVEHSHPPWLVERWLRELGQGEAIRLMQADNEPLPTVLRSLLPVEDAIGALKQHGIDAQPARWAPEGVMVTVARTIPGLVVPQGEGSQLVSLFAGARPGERVLDACAAPGGKAGYLARMVGKQGVVVAVDPGRDAISRIGRTVAACGADNVRAHHCRIEEFQSDEAFDRVLVDAPCSGLGTLSEHPEIRWRRRPEDIDDSSVRQRRILTAAARHVRGGGYLIYATCTLLRSENDEVIHDFLQSHPDFHEEPPDTAPAAVTPMVDPDGRLRTYPHRHGTGGFFAARLRRR